MCDRAYHIGCLDPPLKTFPHRAFKCPHCAKCSSCGITAGTALAHKVKALTWTSERPRANHTHSLIAC